MYNYWSCLFRTIGNGPECICGSHDQYCHWARSSDWQYADESRDWNKIGFEYDKYRVNDKSWKDIWKYGKHPLSVAEQWLTFLQMIDLKATNKKLQQRARNIIRAICGSSSPESDEELDLVLEKCKGSVKLAVATILLNISAHEAAGRLEAAGGVLSKVLKQNNSTAIISLGVNRNSASDFVLCVDGGGSKCAAFLLGPGGQEGRGEAGECNV
jgi:hypothetical protein